MLTTSAPKNKFSIISEQLKLSIFRLILLLEYIITCKAYSTNRLPSEFAKYSPYTGTQKITCMEIQVQDVKGSIKITKMLSKHVNIQCL